MNRSVRNGLAIAGMAGGFLILGQAAASADDAAVSGSNNAAAGNAASYDATASNDNSSTTEGGGGGGDYGDGGNAVTDVDQNADATNDVDNSATTGNIEANGGTSYVVVFAGNGNTVGAASEKGDASASQTVHNEVDVASQGGNATVSDSNNAAAGNGASYNADASNSNHTDTTGGEGGGDHGDGGNAYTDVDQDADADNYVDNDAHTGDIDANGGDSVVVVVAGNGNEAGAESGGKDGDSHGSQVIHNEVGIVSRGGNATVHGSNNAAAGNGGRYNADAHNENDSTTSGGAGGDGDGGNAYTDVDQDSDAENDVDNNASTGDIDANGGDSIIKVVVGNDNTLTCYSEKGDVDCEQHITNIINIISVGGNAGVTCSNNAAAGGSGQWVCHQEAKPAAPAPAPAHQAAPAQQHHKAAAPVHHRAPVNSYAQPKGELAYTGAETTAPLALGLIALGAGGALTLAGRRRTAPAAV